MSLVGGLSLRTKIAAMLIVPIAGMLYFAQGQLRDTWSIARETSQLEQLAKFAGLSGNLVHQLQKERGFTAGYIGSKGARFASELAAQKSSTDSALNNMKEFLADFDAGSFGAGLERKTNAGLDELKRLSEIRSAVTGKRIELQRALRYYTSINAEFLDAVSELAIRSSISELTNMANAYANFLQAKERSGVERAVLAAVFGADAFAPGMYEGFVSLVSVEETYLNVFLSFATQSQTDFYSSKLGSETVREAKRLRRLALDGADADADVDVDGFGVDPTHWFKVQTGKINLLKEVEDYLNEGIDELVTARSAQAHNALVGMAVVTAIIVIASLLLVLLVQRGIVGPVHSAAQVAGAISGGDLTNVVEVSGSDEIGQLSSGLCDMQDKLKQVIGDTQSATASVKAGSAEIAHGNTDLSQRTEEQASSLEQTASSMEQMTATVKQNADNAAQANQLAMAAREEAERGGEVVGRAVSAMSAITASSKKIADIIGVIDEIAFQTNLLALNASVEAARAGEQGRGFAVVASEVRNLAGRSATAAKEIKELIEDSVSEVEDGSQLVNESGERLAEIVQDVKKVTDIVGEIAAASQEQSSGIEEVNRAIHQMDELTQQNAALVEEVAAASVSMGDQAQGLGDIMAFFRFEQPAEADMVYRKPPARTPVTPPRGVERRSVERPWTSTPAPRKEPVEEASTKSGQKAAAAGGSVAGGSAVAGGSDTEWEEF